MPRYFKDVEDNIEVYIALSEGVDRGGKKKKKGKKKGKKKKKNKEEEPEEKDTRM